jgi:hypothetical protein
MTNMRKFITARAEMSTRVAIDSPSIFLERREREREQESKRAREQESRRRL